MPCRLLAPTDFTSDADRAVRYAAALAEELGAELELVHLCPAAREPYHLARTSSRLETEPPEAEAACRPRLQSIVDELSARGVRVTALVTGPTRSAAALRDAAERADLIVMAPRGIAGDVAEAGRHARSPMLIAGPVTGRLGLGVRVLVPVDLSPASAAALREARVLAAALGGAVEAVHAVPDEPQASAWGGEPVEATDGPEAARRLRYVERFVADVLERPETSLPPDATALPVRVQLVEGEPVEAVAQLAREGRAGLVHAGRPGDRPTTVDRLLAAVGEAALCPAAR